MGEILVNLNALVYLYTCFRIVKRYGLFNPGAIIFEFITLTALLAIPAYKVLAKDYFFSRYDFSNVTFLPFVYLFVLNLLIIKPLFNVPEAITTHNINYSFKFIRNFSYLYIVCALISIYLNYKLLITSYLGVEWSEIRNMQYEGEALMAYNNIFERFFLSFTAHLRLVACISFMLFFLFHRDKVKTSFLVMLLISIIIPMFMDAMRIASRGMLITILFQFAFLIGFFYKYINKKKLKQICIVVGLFMFFAYGYSMAVTASRFGETSGNESALISYWGQPQIIFNSAISGIDNCWFGKYSFGNLFAMLDLPTSYSDRELGTRFLPCFTTIVGNLYTDFHFIGPLLFAGLIFFITKKIFKKNSFTIGDVVVLYFICLELQHGALVMRYSFLWDTNILIITLLYIFFNKYSVQKSIL